MPMPSKLSVIAISRYNNYMPVHDSRLIYLDLDMLVIPNSVVNGKVAPVKMTGWAISAAAISIPLLHGYPMIIQWSSNNDGSYRRSPFLSMNVIVTFGSAVVYQVGTHSVFLPPRLFPMFQSTTQVSNCSCDAL